MSCFLVEAQWQRHILDLGRELGFGSIEHDSFNYCGKRITQLDDGTIRVSMEEYHKNIQPVTVAVARKQKLDSELTPAERRQLRAILGSLQWLVAQVRSDFGFQLSTLQSEKPVVATLLKANAGLCPHVPTHGFGWSWHYGCDCGCTWQRQS